MAGNRPARNTTQSQARDTAADAPADTDAPTLHTEQPTRSGDGTVEGSGSHPTPGADGTVPGEPAVSTADDQEGQRPAVATPDAGHEDQVPTSQPEGIESPDEQPALSASTEFVDYDVDPADQEATAKHLLEAAESVGADVEREVLVIGGGFRVSQRVADAAAL